MKRRPESMHGICPQIGEVIDHVKVIGYEIIPTATGPGRKLCLCQCVCGNERIIKYENWDLRSKKYSRSCGCVIKEKKLATYKQTISKRNLTRAPFYAKINNLYSQHAHAARVRDLDFTITRQDFEKIILLPCAYCGIQNSNGSNTFKYNGIDRANNTLGYILSNTLPACHACNWCKSNLTVDSFRAYINILASNKDSKARQERKPLAWFLVRPIRNGNYWRRYSPERMLAVSVYRDYKRHAKRRKLTWDITLSAFINLMELPCHYCGTAESNFCIVNNYWMKYTGVDRMDNKTGYTNDNCVPCCATCNRSKLGDSYTVFNKWIERIILFNRSNHRQISKKEVLTLQLQEAKIKRARQFVIETISKQIAECE